MSHISQARNHFGVARMGVPKMAKNGFYSSFEEWR
jgi:hypothetical protein